MNNLKYQANFGDFDVYVDENNACALKKYHPEVAAVGEAYTLSGQDLKTLLFECHKVNEVENQTERNEHKMFVEREILV
ncbi:hypothetical protein [Ligilactobacillus pobuzihii]|uniref:Uncharacterized protein n=1 Tax=Ligilactobacillus pobuzihii TaxID=449659 RepID=A0A0R2LLB6_9LACO|nr:hypothetical protein [Ligilactobacillus pobuzihii]KRK11297.1 hypothetical protein FD11_GL000036 [Ligilactobacillus pobuzihii E100301 = KCTC 13174]KRO02612.1 hypothetical protein IV66_GL000036 [Ligilactobacillus pobuzihii]GEN47437.1 hypothetical protein LPO01_02290 [Ligilactobacillus pobuzihii]